MVISAGTYADDQRVVGVREAQGGAVQRQLAALQIGNNKLLVVPGRSNVTGHKNHGAIH